MSDVGRVRLDRDRLCLSKFTGKISEALSRLGIYHIRNSGKGEETMLCIIIII